MTSLDKLTIDTPEQIALELPLAGIGSRFLALAFDTLLQFIVAVAGFLVFLLLIPALNFFGRLPAALGPALFILFMFSLYWGYFALFEIIWKGQTPGKRHAGIRVIKNSGRPITVWEAIARNLMRVIDGLPGLYAVGVITMMFNGANRRLGDFVAGTVVVHERARAEVSPSWTMAAVEPASGAAQDLSAITSDDLVLIETYLHRRFEIDPAIRAATVQKIAAIVEQKTGLVAETSGESQDNFLERIAREVRNHARFR